MDDARLIELEIPEQGVSRRLSVEEAITFLMSEQTFYSGLREIMPGQIRVIDQNLSIDGNNVVNTSVQYIQRSIQALKDGKDQPLESYVQAARNLQILVGAGRFGEAIKAYQRAGMADEARWIAILLSHQGLDSGWQQRLKPWRALLFAGPGFATAADLTVTRAAAERSEQAEKTSREAALDLDKFIKERTDLIDDLETKFRTRLVLEEPARHWGDVAKRKTTAWRVWLAAFAFLIVVPLFLLLCNISTFKDFVLSLTKTDQQGLSLGGVAAITAPALFYAWLLKNVSRGFIQTLALADDAEHRKSLALTYLGLAEQPKLEISKEERALILNALFRPLPYQTGDEGPPTGLLDIIKGEKRG